MTKPPRVTGTLRARPPHRYAPEPSPRGGGRGKNAYHCDTCGGYVVTIDRDPGTTPMFLACRVEGDPREPGYDGCAGQMASMMYPDEPWPIDATPTWEWYRPDASEVATYDAAMRDHVERGGLALRKIEAVA